ncbi:MAG TPA: hypothetical protein VGS23_07655 [Thermoplasmata archaeon]|nr:hypothetical protein [Thermoplasmata archaeon]
MAYDASDGYLVLLGQTTTGPQTWAFSQGAWRQLPISVSPESCDGSVMAYDAFYTEVVYLGGGDTNCSSAGQTWAFHAGTWRQLHPVASPPEREGAAFTNLSTGLLLLLFGGFNASTQKFYGDTWFFNGTNWTPRAFTTAPSNRSGAGLTYDAADGYALLFGGSANIGCGANRGPEGGGLGCMDRDTWKYQYNTWTLLHPTGAVPPEPNDDGLTYDGADGAALYTVTDDNFTYYDPEIYWSFTAGNWTDLNHWGPRDNGSLPSNRMGESLAYDWGDGYVVLFGGANLFWQSLSDTWAYRAGTWTNITPYSALLTASPPRTDVGIATILHATVLGGGTGPFTFSYAGLPSGCVSRDVANLTCLPTQAGAFSVNVTVTNATSATANATFHLVVNATPSVSSFASIPPAPVLGESVELTVGISGGTPAFSFYYTGLPPGCVTSFTSTLNCTPTQSGGYLVSVLVGDAVGETATSNLTLVIGIPGANASALSGSFAIVPSEISLGSSVSFELSASGGNVPLGFSYSGLPANCTAGAVWDWSCVPSVTGTFQVSVSIHDSVGHTVRLSESLTVSLFAGTLAVLAFFASPAVVEVGRRTVMEAIVSGGAPPYGFSYSGTPAGCASRSTALLSCVPSAAGNYSISVTVRDALGATAMATSVLVVEPLSSSPGTNAGYSGPPALWIDIGLGAAVSALGLAVVAVVSRPGRHDPKPKG